jgi:hypothetical protein
MRINQWRSFVRIIAIVIGLSFLSSPASAADKMKPGLWEVIMQSDEMRKMPQLTPEQLEQMRSAGVHVPDAQPEGVITKICITREMSESGSMPMAQNESDCQAKNYRRKENLYSIDVICKGPNIEGKGKVNGKLDNAEKFTSTYQFKGMAHGKPFMHRHERTGKWLNENCGNVKPAEEMLKK